MTTKAKSLSVENIAAHFVGGRLSNQPTSAREKRYYGDPAAWIRFDSEKGTRMKNLVRQETAGDSFDALSPVDKLLTIWADYISLRDSNEPGGFANPQDVKDFMRIGEAVEAMINDLRRHQWWAVRKSRGICSVWIFKDAIYDDALAQARDILEKKMRVHIATARFFN